MTRRALSARALSTLFGTLLLAGCGGGGGGEAAKPGLLIGLSMDTLQEERWQSDRDLFVARAKELGAEVLVQAANGDDAKQIQDVESLLSRRVAALVIIPHDGRAMAKAVDRARQDGVPVISYDRLILDSEPNLYLTFDNVKVGEMQARHIAAHLPATGKLKLVRVYGSPTDNNAKLFKQGQDNVLTPLIEQGTVEVVHEDWAEDWRADNAKKIVNAAITKAGKDIGAVLASNDGTAGGAVQALEEEGLGGKVIVTGQDADLVACQRIVAGTQAMTVYKPLKNLAHTAADLAVKLARKEAVPTTATVNNGRIDVPSVLLDIVAVTRENLDATVIADGFHKKEAVYKGAK